MQKTFTPVFSWIPAKLHSCQTYQHHHWPSTRVPWHHITLLYCPLSSFLPAQSTPSPPALFLLSPRSTHQRGRRSHGAEPSTSTFWGLGKAPARNINCTHSGMHVRSCLLAGALVSPELIKCTEEGWCWIRFASHPRNSVCSLSCFWPQTLLWFSRMKQHLKGYLGSSRKTFSPSALHGKSWQGSKVAQWHPAGGLSKGWEPLLDFLSGPIPFPGPVLLFLEHLPFSHAVG